MRETVKDWKDEWIQTNGVTDDLEVVITDGALAALNPYVYEGSFAKIPDTLLLRKVIRHGRVAASSVEERYGAYSLTI